MANIPPFAGSSPGRESGAPPLPVITAANLTTLVSNLQNITKAINNLEQTIGSKFPDWVTVPASSSSSGTAGQIAYDSSYLYICVSSSLWRRVALSAY